MDVHAHMFKTEVVGLLGGECLPDSSYIRIKCAVPCRSISTRIQCEMDAGKLRFIPSEITIYQFTNSIIYISFLIDLYLFTFLRFVLVVDKIKII